MKNNKVTIAIVVPVAPGVFLSERRRHLEVRRALSLPKTAANLGCN